MLGLWSIRNSRVQILKRARTFYFCYPFLDLDFLQRRQRCVRRGKPGQNFGTSLATLCAWNCATLRWLNWAVAAKLQQRCYVTSPLCYSYNSRYFSCEFPVILISSPKYRYRCTCHYRYQPFLTFPLRFKKFGARLELRIAHLQQPIEYRFKGTTKKPFYSSCWTRSTFYDKRGKKFSWLFEDPPAVLVDVGWSSLICVEKSFNWLLRKDRIEGVPFSNSGRACVTGDYTGFLSFSTRFVSDSNHCTTTFAKHSD